MKSKGFTIPELLVALLIFSLIVGGAVNLLFTGIAAQRHFLASGEVIDQTSFLAEYMSRRVRQAQKDLVGTCLSQAGLNYEKISEPGDGGIRFLNNGGQCHTFFLENGRIKEVIGPPGTSAQELTSDNLLVNALDFELMGEDQVDDVQPRVSFIIDIQGQGIKPGSRPRIQLQTTVSQRKIDVLQ